MKSWERNSLGCWTRKKGRRLAEEASQTPCRWMLCFSSRVGLYGYTAGDLFEWWRSCIQNSLINWLLVRSCGGNFHICCRHWWSACGFKDPGIGINSGLSGWIPVSMTGRTWLITFNQIDSTLAFWMVHPNTTGLTWTVGEIKLAFNNRKFTEIGFRNWTFTIKNRSMTASYFSLILDSISKCSVESTCCV